MWNLAITEEQFISLYGEGVDTSIFKSAPSNEEELWRSYMVSKLWRLNNLYTITDKHGVEVRFRMNYAQHFTFSKSLIHPRLIILKSRQQGISTLWLVSFFDDALILDNYEIGIMTQGLAESKNLFRRVKRLWNSLPPFVTSYLGIKLVKDNSEALAWNTGSVIYIQSSFRSGTLQRLHISELGKISAKAPEKAREVKTGSLQAIKSGNTVVLESTAEGRKNMFYEMWYQASDHKGVLAGKDFMPVFLSWTVDADCTLEIPQRIEEADAAYFIKLENALGISLSSEQKWWYVAQKRELGDSMGQEYPGTPEEAFSAVRDGTYYAVLYRNLVVDRGREIPELYDSALPVEVAMDLGMNDTMVLVFFQRYMREIRLIDCYSSSGEGLEHYVNVMFSRGYKYGAVWTPHDVQVRELGTGVSRLVRLRELGVRPRVLRRSSVNAGIEQVRKMLEWVYIDPIKCKLLVDTMFSYTKEWDDKNSVWKDKPLHDFWSNPADALRYVAESRGTGREVPTSMRRIGRSNVVDGLAL